MISAENLVSNFFPLLKQKSTLYKIACGLTRFMIRESDFQKFSRDYPHAKGFNFIDLVMEYFDFDVSLAERDRAQIPSSGRLVIVANHPLGSLDGLALLRLVSHVRRDVKIVANNHLSVVSALDDLIFPVDNMGGSTTKTQIKAIHEYLNNEGAVIIFPAGEVSRFGLKGVRDGLWSKGFLRIARTTKSPILPIHVRARNSVLFYLTSLAFKRLSAALLVREMFGQAKKTVPVRVGDLVEPEGLTGMAANDNALAKLFRKHVEQIGKGKKGLFKTHRAVAQAERSKAVLAELSTHEILGETPDGKVIYLAKDIWDSVLLREIARLRELSFRAVGQGTGRSRDFDDYDHDYFHLVLWDRQDMEIVGAYRLGDTEKLIRQGGIDALYTSQLFEVGERMSPYLGQGLELGRSFVQPKYWGKRSLEYLWIGIGAFLKKNPNYRYMFGAVSVSGQLPRSARDLLVYFYRLYFQKEQGVVKSRHPYKFEQKAIEQLAITFSGENYKKDFQHLKSSLANMGVSVPTLFKQYTELTEVGGTQFFDFGCDPNFANAIDGMVMVDLNMVKEKKRNRYMGSPHTVEAA